LSNGGRERGRGKKGVHRKEKAEGEKKAGCRSTWDGAG
jgi:hypothetical protein